MEGDNTHVKYRAVMSKAKKPVAPPATREGYNQTQRKPAARNTAGPGTAKPYTGNVTGKGRGNVTRKGGRGR
jgi:hypothetical protein